MALFNTRVDVVDGGGESSSSKPKTTSSSSTTTTSSSATNSVSTNNQDIMQSMFDDSKDSVSSAINNELDSGNNNDALIADLRKQYTDILTKINTNKSLSSAASIKLDKYKDELINLSNLQQELITLSFEIAGVISDYKKGGYVSDGEYYHQTNFENIKKIINDDISKIDRSIYTIGQHRKKLSAEYDELKTAIDNLIKEKNKIAVMLKHLEIGL